MDFLVGLDFLNTEQINLNFGELWGIIFLFSSFAYIIKNKTDVMVSKSHRLLFLLCVLALFPLIFFTEDYILGIAKYSKWLTWILGFYVIYDIFKKNYYFKKFESKISLMAYSVVVIYIVGFILEKVLGINLSDSLGYSVYGYDAMQEGVGFTSFFYSTHTISFLSFFLITLLYLKNCNQKNLTKNDMFLISFLILIIIAVLARTGILTLILFILLTFRRNKKLFFLFSIILLIIMISIINEAIINQRLLWDYMLYTTGNTTTTILGSGRLGMWDAIIKFFSDQNVFNQLLGSGFDADFRATELFWYRRGAHNDFLDMLIGTGVVSLIIYLLFLINMKIDINLKIKTLTNNEKFLNIFNAFFWSTLVWMFFQGITMTTMMFYYMLIIAYSYGKIDLLHRNLHINKIVHKNI